MPSLTLDIARRYLFGKKSTNSINIITGISVFGISIGTAALILILSVFNGFEGLLSGLFNSFNPDIQVLPSEGKYFKVSDKDLLALEALPEVVAVSKTIEEHALFEYKDRQELGMIKGVDVAYGKVTGLDTMAIDGKYILQKEQVQYGYIGVGMRNKLSINIDDRLSSISIYMPTSKTKMMGTKEFNSKIIYPAGVFSVKSDNDSYVITSLSLATSLLNKADQVSALEVKMKEDTDTEIVKTQMAGILGDQLTYKDRYQQDESFLKVMRIEKWISFLITGLTMFLIAFNLLGALWMIVLDKQKDISVLKSLGFNSSDVRWLFLKLGLLISILGILLGFVIALIFYFLQVEYGLIGVPDGFLMDSYPVKLKLTDFLLVSITVLGIGWLASLIPSNQAAKSLKMLKIS